MQRTLRSEVLSRQRCTQGYTSALARLLTLVCHARFWRAGAEKAEKGRRAGGFEPRTSDVTIPDTTLPRPLSRLASCLLALESRVQLINIDTKIQLRLDRSRLATRITLASQSVLTPANMVDEQKTPKLKVIVVGAGICGLACGVAMRSYADVTVSRQRRACHVRLTSPLSDPRIVQGDQGNRRCSPPRTQLPPPRTRMGWRSAQVRQRREQAIPRDGPGSQRALPG